MDVVLSLITAPSGYVLGPRDVAKAREFLGNPGIPHWLAPGLACDIPFHLDPHESAEPILLGLRESFADGAVDLNVLNAEGRRKKLLIADMDSTIIGQECIDELADFVGQRARVSAITERAMRGELVFEEALRERVALLEGMETDTLEAVFSTRIHLNPGAKALTATMRAHGAYTALVSGGFTFFTSRVARMAGFDMHQSNELLMQNGKCTGKVGEPILGRDAKLKALIDLRQRFSLDSSETLGVGDGANDLAMILEAGLGVAHHAKPVVAEKAKARLDHADLTGLLYLQGYHAGEITP